MNFIEIFLLAISLSMDAFAVSLCKGMSIKKVNIEKALKVGIYFGFFQGIMPIIGFFMGTYFNNIFDKIDHFIVFALLTYISFSMIKDSLSEENNVTNQRIDIKEMLALSIATSIDALAIGITFAFLNVGIIVSSLTISITCFIVCLFGVYLGSKFGNKYEKKATLLGGIILFFIGFKILLEHLGFF